MDIHLSPDQEARLAELAARDGRTPDDVATEAVARFLDEDARFAEAVRLGIESADRGEFVTADEVWARVERVLGS